MFLIAACFSPVCERTVTTSLLYGNHNLTILQLQQQMVVEQLHPASLGDLMHWESYEFVHEVNLVSGGVAGGHKMQ
jgi:hypothetical protein